MKNETITTMVLWIKRVLGFVAITLWMYVIYTISKSSAPFMEQAPYCMASTMLIFGIVSMAYKGLDYWGQQNRPKQQKD